MIEKILLADAGRGPSEKMLKALMKVPYMQRANVTLLNVIPNKSSETEMTENRATGQAVMEKAIASLDLDPNKTNMIIREGDPKGVVCEVAEELQTDLLIMGSRGLKRLESILSNSVSQYVFQLSSRPMLLVKDDIYIRDIERITVAMDKSDASKQCLEMAIAMLRDIPNSTLNLIRVDPKAKTELVGREAAQDPILAEASKQAERYGNISIRCFVGTGKAGKAICRLADSAKTDLLILGSPDRRPSIAKNMPDLDRLLGNSLSDYVRVNATFPVLLARTLG
ncbi:universal stress protein [filamentous cyanobacterium LEGE 11480]|uniref:Universal stress protein n=1 Tax=Romeriopsis navalis LEGE 11480 TaxID=2777977 RepID=A0A928Z4C9_9CYAN|nr:universal stress protein [Romeriopsis navalis]MBE9030902.1 universal stress protein [Romeriopsis navalis LEGE 11480]